MTHICKEDLYSRSANLVPNFAARWHLFCKHFFTSKINHNTKQTKEPVVYKINPFTPQKEGPNNEEIPVKSNEKSNPP